MITASNEGSGSGVKSEAVKGMGDDAYLLRVKRSVESIKYGSVTLNIQDGKVIQIDVNEKFRLNKYEEWN